MLAFTLRMIITDIQKSFHGFWIILYLFLFWLITVGPFFEDSFFYIYMIMIVFSAFVPHITKIFYVLPFGSKLLRKYLYLRVIVLASLFIIVGGTMTLIFGIWYEPNLERGSLAIMFYIQLTILMNLPSIIAATGKNNKKNTKNIVLFILVCAVGAVNAAFLISFKLQVLISAFAIIASEAMNIIELRKANLMNYKEQIYYGLYTKAWRNQQRILAASAEKKKSGQDT